MSDDPWLTAISPDDIEAAMQRKAAREALIVEQAAEITRLRAALATARREGMKEAAKWHELRAMELSGKAGLARNFRQLLRQSDFHMESAAAIRTAALDPAVSQAAADLVATARREAEQERDEFFNRLGRITEYLDLPVDATAQRIIETIQERVDSEREACASVEVRLTVPEGAESWTPLEAWEEALLAFDEAFRDAIRAAAGEVK